MGTNSKGRAVSRDLSLSRLRYGKEEGRATWRAVYSVCPVVKPLPTPTVGNNASARLSNQHGIIAGMHFPSSFSLLVSPFPLISCIPLGQREKKPPAKIADTYFLLSSSSAEDSPIFLPGRRRSRCYGYKATKSTLSRSQSSGSCILILHSASSKLVLPVLNATNYKRRDSSSIA